MSEFDMNLGMREVIMNRENRMGFTFGITHLTVAQSILRIWQSQLCEHD